MLARVVGAEALDTHRLTARRRFLTKADVELAEADLEELPALRRSFAASIRPELGAEIERLTGGAPRRLEPLGDRGTFHALFRIETAAGESLVARTSLPPIPGPAVEFLIDEWVAERLPAHGVPVPPVRHVDLSRDRLDYDLEILEAVAGDPLPGGREADAAVTALGAVVARVHTLPCRGFGALDPASLESTRPPRGLRSSWPQHLTTRLEEHLSLCRRIGALDADGERAAASAFRDTGPLLADAPSALLHGDLANANVIVAEGRIAALLDWEDSLAGDPVFDIAAWGTFVGNHERLSAFVAGYREVAALPDDFELRYRLYYLRILLAKTVHRHRFGYDRTDRIPAAERLRPALEALRERPGS